MRLYPRLPFNLISFLQIPQPGLQYSSSTDGVIVAPRQTELTSYELIHCASSVDLRLPRDERRLNRCNASLQPLLLCFLARLGVAHYDVSSVPAGFVEGKREGGGVSGV